MNLQCLLLQCGSTVIPCPVLCSSLQAFLFPTYPFLSSGNICHVQHKWNKVINAAHRKSLANGLGYEAEEFGTGGSRFPWQCLPRTRSPALMKGEFVTPSHLYVSYTIPLVGWRAPRQRLRGGRRQRQQQWFSTRVIPNLSLGSIYLSFLLSGSI